MNNKTFKTNSKIKNKFKLAIKVNEDNVKWEELYDSIEELQKDLMGIDVNNINFQWIKGQDYIMSFQKQIDSGKVLTKAQTVMLKKLAKEIAKFYTLD